MIQKEHPVYNIYPARTVFHKL